MPMEYPLPRLRANKPRTQRCCTVFPRCLNACDCERRSALLDFGTLLSGGKYPPLRGPIECKSPCVAVSRTRVRRDDAQPGRPYRETALPSLRRPTERRQSTWDAFLRTRARAERGREPRGSARRSCLARNIHLASHERVARARERRDGARESTAKSQREASETPLAQAANPRRRRRRRCRS